MTDLERLLKDEVIDKRKLLTKNFKLIGLSEVQALLILRIVDLEEKDKITINSISKHLEISKVEAEELVGSLIHSKLVKVKHTKQEMLFNIKELWVKLMEIYYPPSDDSATEDKIFWFLSHISIKPTPMVKQEVKEWVKKGGWKRMVSIVESLSRNQIHSLEWKTLRKLYISESKEKSATMKQIKKLAERNWLLD